MAEQKEIDGLVIFVDGAELARVFAKRIDELETRRVALASVPLDEYGGGRLGVSQRVGLLATSIEATRFFAEHLDAGARYRLKADDIITLYGAAGAFAL